MRELTFKTGGKLEYCHWVDDDEDGEGGYVPLDVTDRAVAYVMEPVRFDGEIYVRDIFSLLDRNPALVEMFSRSYAAEYLEEAKKGNADAYTGEYDPTGIEYLELFYDWEKNRKTGELGGVHRLWVTGEGYKLRDDVVEGGVILHSKGTRIGWAIKFSPVGQLLNYPLRFNPKVMVVDSRDINRTTHIFHVPLPTLAQVISAVMWELSWGGNPQQTEEFVEMIHEISDEKHMSGPMSLEEFSVWLQKAGGEERARGEPGSSLA